MKKLIFVCALLFVMINCFSQTKKDTVTRVIVIFPDSLSYKNFMDYIGAIPISNPYSNIYPYFKSLPVQLEKIPADKPKK